MKKLGGQRQTGCGVFDGRTTRFGELGRSGDSENRGEGGKEGR